MALLQDLVYGDEGFEGLYFISEDGLPGRMNKLGWKGREEKGPMGTGRTLSCQPRRIVRTYGPRYRRYSCEHVFLVV